RPEPISYYVREGPVGDVFRAVANGETVDTAAVVGLGAGNIACYRNDGERWTFYEIDPLVEHLARNPDYFTYLSECAPRSPVVLGDGRLAIEAAGDGAYDLIVLDAFSSDAVPVHLMTREAFDLYLEKLAAGGILLVNISNSYVRLRPVVAALAADRGLAGRARLFVPDRPAEARREYRLPSEWVVLARDEGRLSGLDGLPGWEDLDPDGAPLWTDDFSNLVAALKWRF
ncbi:MAG: spermidine synthase, partial [Gemmatimonadota bacterium]